MLTHLDIRMKSHEYDLVITPCITPSLPAPPKSNLSSNLLPPPHSPTCPYSPHFIYIYTTLPLPLSSPNLTPSAMSNLAVPLAVIFSLLFVLSHARFLVAPDPELTSASLSKHSPEDFAADLLIPNAFGSVGEDRRPHRHMMRHRYWHHRAAHCGHHHGRREISYGKDVMLGGKPGDQIYVVEDRVVEKREEGGWMGKVRKFLDTFAL